MHHEHHHRMIEQRSPASSFYDPRFQDESLVGWLGFLVLGPALLLFGTALGWEALVQYRADKPPARWAVFGSLALSAVATGAAFLFKALQNRHLFKQFIETE